MIPIGYRLGLLLASYQLMSTKANDAFYSAVRTETTMNSDVCSVDPPTVIVPMKKSSSSVLRCAGECLAYIPCCATFQYDGSLEQCQLYDYTPRNFTPVVNCKAFSLSEKRVVDAERGCSFPFTLNGQLYYQCAVLDNSASKCNIGCHSANNAWAICTPQTHGFISQNTTVTVTIPTASNVMLRSVNGWLTIFSRVDTTFPVGQPDSAYVSGFGDINSNFWMGLNRIHLLTYGSKYQLRIEVLAITDHGWYSEEYDMFYIGHDYDGYRLQVSAAGTGDAGDKLNENSPANSHQFSMYSSSCVNAFGPWWYTEPNTFCGACRFFGTAGTTGFAWGNIGNLLVGRMMMRAD